MYGYFAQGVGTAILPKGWQQGVHRVESAATGGAVGWCIDTHDLAIAKYVAHRPKDGLFLDALREAGLIRLDVLLARATRLDDPQLAEQVATRIRADFGDRDGSPSGRPPRSG